MEGEAVDPHTEAFWPVNPEEPNAGLLGAPNAEDAGVAAAEPKVELPNAGAAGAGEEPNAVFPNAGLFAFSAVAAGVPQGDARWPMPEDAPNAVVDGVEKAGAAACCAGAGEA